MSASLPIDALGVRVALDLTGCDETDAVAVRAAWQDAAALTDGDPEATVRVREDGDTSDTAQLLERLSQRVTLAAIDARRGALWMLHAAGLVLPDGRVIVLIGPSGRGKTTASRALGEALGYASDESIAIDADGRVFAYRKPLSIIEGGVYPKVQRAPSELGLAPVPDVPLRLGALVLLDRQVDGPDEPVIEPVDVGDALEDLVSQSSYLPSLPEPLQLMARLAASVGGIQRVTYREATSLAPLAPLLAGRAPLAPSVGRVPARSAGVPRPPQATRSLWHRTPSLDALALDDPDRIALLQDDGAGGGTVRVLAGIAPTLWRAASGGTRDELLEAALAEHGEPDGTDAGAAVDAALAELAAAGIVTETPDEPVWRIRDDVAWTGSAGRYVALPLDRNAQQPLVLEGAAGLLWGVLAEQESSVEGLVSLLAGEVGESPTVLRADISTFMASAEDQGLLTSVRPTAG